MIKIKQAEFMAFQYVPSYVKYILDCLTVLKNSWKKMLFSNQINSIIIIIYVALISIYFKFCSSLFLKTVISFLFNFESMLICFFLIKYSNYFLIS